ncbi:hypothetical protein C2S51_001446 [Perilla frutescens var. frutescens]|nr:hypothetical protein C2S51_001446 [Perilla frutescens var. frutescens]
MAEPTTPSHNISNELALQIANILKTGINSIPNQTSNNSEKISLSIKLNGDNYPLWARLMRVEIGVRGKTGYITGASKIPTTDETEILRWEQSDLGVFSWILHNIEPNLINNVAEYQTAKALWDALAVTYGSGGDALQVYDLHNKASRQNQENQTLEQYWNTLQGLWLAIDRRRPNPMKHDEDITAYNQIVQEHRLFDFLGGLDRRYDGARREILRSDPLPSVESAYATIRKEAARIRIMRSATSETADLSSSGEIGAGLLSKTPGRGGHRRPDNRMGKPVVDKTKLHCSHCGMTKHTKETCFKLVGYPEWWEDGHKAGKSNNNGKAAAAVGSSTAADSSDGHHEVQQGGERQGFAALIGSSGGGQPSEDGDGRGKEGFEGFSSPSLFNLQITPSHYINPANKSSTNIAKDNESSHYSSPANKSSTNIAKDNKWIFDCGATDTMTYDPTDLDNIMPTTKQRIHTANGGVSFVNGAGEAKISSNIKLQCLFVPSLACKLLSVSQVTRELNCRVLMYPTFCILQDILTQAIIGRGTESNGLYVVDEVSQRGVARLAHGTPDRQLWLWHRRLGHPSAGYLKHLFPSLFSNNPHLSCETCILAKSHRTTFRPNYTRVDTHQGESVRDSLSWLCPPDIPQSVLPDIEVPQEPARYTIETPSSIPTQSEAPVSSTQLSPVEDIPEVHISPDTYTGNNTVHDDDVEKSISETNTEMSTVQADQEEHSQGEEQMEHEEQAPVEHQRRILPPRSNRGVPPRKYSPEHKPRTSRYPVANTVRGNLTEMAMTFETALSGDKLIPNDGCWWWNDKPHLTDQM